MNTSSITNTKGFTILRFALATVFLWFGFSQLLDTTSWTGLVPDWALTLSGLSAYKIVQLNGLLEIAGGACIATNLWVRYASLILGVHLAIITFDIGISPTGVRDFGLTLSTFALYFLSQNELSTYGDSESSC